MNKENLQLRRLGENDKVLAFDCGDEDLNDFILTDAPLYYRVRLATSYVWEDSITGEVFGYFSLAHEFKSTDAMRKAVERHAFPWPCFVDLDDEFGVFHKHGTQNSALFLIDRDGTIIAVPNSVEELKAKLEEIFPNNK